MIDIALKIAISAHTCQKDLGGDFYILHPLRVMAKVNGIDEKTVALLHDVLEDSSIDLSSYGLPKRIINAVRCLTKKKGETYDDYIDKVSYNKLARTVKIADLEDNMNIRRLKHLTASDQARLAKYQKAWAYLKCQQSEYFS